MTTPEEPGQPPYGGPPQPPPGQPPQPPPGQPPYGGPPQPPPGQPPYGSQPLYGQPYGSQPPFGQPYGAPPPGYGAPQGVLADWGSRVVGGLIDYFVPGVIAAVGFDLNRGLGFLLWIAAIVWIVYNKVIEGQTGQSIGKRVAGTRLVRASDGQLVGAGLAIGRWLLHILDGLPCYLGYLWPLWDAKKQTFADKIVNTVVLKV